MSEHWTDDLWEAHIDAWARLKMCALVVAGLVAAGLVVLFWWLVGLSVWSWID